jgi:hypothetical protein
LASWIVMAPLLGGIQAIASFLVPMLQHGDPGNRDLRTLLVGLSVGYGGAWFVPALVLSDVLVLRRVLSRSDYGRYIRALALAAGGIGCVFPGILVMVGYPLTAAAILGCGFWYRRPTEPTRE